MHAQRSFRCKYKGADIQRSFRFRRNPVLFHLYQFFNCFYKHIFRKSRHTQTLIGSNHPLCVHFRTEQKNSAVFGTVRLQSFKGFLGIMKRYAGWVDFYGAIRLNSGVMPANSLIPVHHKHIVRHIFAKSQIFLIRFLF